MEHPDFFTEWIINIDQKAYEENLDAVTYKPSEKEEKLIQ